MIMLRARLLQYNRERLSHTTVGTLSANCWSVCCTGWDRGWCCKICWSRSGGRTGLGKDCPVCDFLDDYNNVLLKLRCLRDGDLAS